MSIITGKNHEIYWATENTFKYGEAGMPVTGTRVHQPFNPIEGKIKLPFEIPTQELIYTTDSLDPNANLSYSNERPPGEALFPNDKGMIYHDPFLMLALVFTNKTVSGSWSGGAGTYGQIKGDFVNDDDKDTVMIQYKKVDDDAVAQFEKTLHGVLSQEFRIGFEKGGVLRTKYNLKSAKVVDNSQAYSASGNFDDGRWADWAKSTFYLAANCKVYWDDSYAAELTDIDVYSCWFIITTPIIMQVESASLTPFAYHRGNRSYSIEITGNVKGDTELDELEEILSNKTKKNMRLQWDTTASEEKFIDIDDAFLDSIDGREIPAASENYEKTLTFKGFSCDFEGNYNNLPDPSARINN